MTEKELQHKIKIYLETWFYVQDEVWDTHKKKRIDLVLIHKSDLYDKEFPIGIEVKTDEKKRGKNLANWLKQASEYSTLNFEGFGKILTFCYPQIAGKYMEEGTDISKHDVFSSYWTSFHHNVSTFLGQFGIGELQRYKHDNKEFLRLTFKSFLIWDNRTDIFRTDNYKKCMTK